MSSALFEPPARPAPGHSHLSREQLIERILTQNIGARREFLDSFSDAALAVYLDHLHSAQTPRGRTAVWVRPGDTPAIMVRVAPE